MNDLKIDGKRAMKACRAVNSSEPEPHATVRLYTALRNRVSFFWPPLRHNSNEND